MGKIKEKTKSTLEIDDDISHLIDTEADLSPPPNSSEDSYFKATKVEKDIRVTKVFELITRGFRRSHIIQYIQTEQAAWGMSERAIDKYITYAMDAFANELLIDRKQALGRCLAKISRLFFESMQVKDYKTALSCVKEEATLLGFYRTFIDLDVKTDNKMVLEIHHVMPDAEMPEDTNVIE